MTIRGSTSSSRLSADAPIFTCDEDLLGRRKLAAGLADIIRRAPVEQGFAIGVTGCWGSGKSSVLNLVRELLCEDEDVERQPFVPMLNVVEKALRVYQGIRPTEMIKVIDFNAWLFAGQGDPASSFFREIGQIARHGGFGPRPRSLAKHARRYAVAVSSLGGLAAAVAGLPASVSVAVRAASDVARLRSPRELTDQRSRLAKALRGSGCRIVAIIDDLDRLDQKGICEVFRLVKAVGNLPQVVYVLAFDRPNVEEALERGGFGKEYLEKVLQLQQELPELRADTLQRVAQSKLERCIGQTLLAEEGTARWSRILEGVTPLLRTPRDIHRLANHVVAALALLDGEVSTLDVVALEALCLAAPGTRGILADNPEIFAPSMWNFFPGPKVDAAGLVVGRLRTASGRSGEAVDTLLAELFPRSNNLSHPAVAGDNLILNAHRRVGLQQFLLIYLTSTLDDDDLPADIVWRALAAVDDPTALNVLLDTLDDDQIGTLASRLWANASEISPEHAVGVAQTFLQIGRRIAVDSPFAPIGYSNQYLLTLALLKRLSTPNDQADAVCTLARTAGLSEAALLLQWFSPAPNREAPPEDVLLSEQQAQQLRRETANRVLDTDPADLNRERLVGSLCALAVEEDGPRGRELVRNSCLDDSTFMALLRTANVGTPGESWDFACRLFGENELRARVREFNPGALTDHDRRTINAARDWADGGHHSATASRETDSGAPHDQSD